MDFNIDYILEDQIIFLRPLELSDFDHLKEYSVQEPDIWEYSLMGAEGEENLKTYLKTAIDNRQKKKEYPFIVFDKRVKKYIGSTRFYDVQLENETIQLGFTWYGKKYQGTGINKHCKYLLLEFAFEKLNMKRVEFRANAKNERSIQAMKSIGCTVEGILRNNVIASNGNRRDTIILSILQEEWNQEVKQNLLKRLN